MPLQSITVWHLGIEQTMCVYRKQMKMEISLAIISLILVVCNCDCCQHSIASNLINSCLLIDNIAFFK